MVREGQTFKIQLNINALRVRENIDSEETSGRSRVHVAPLKLHEKWGRCFWVNLRIFFDSSVTFRMGGNNHCRCGHPKKTSHLPAG